MADGVMVRVTGDDISPEGWEMLCKIVLYG